MIKKIKIKNLEFQNNLFLAPLAGISVKPFRVNAKKFGAGLVFSEMISSYGLVYNNEKTFRMLDVFDEKEKPVCVQIFGNDAKILADAAVILEEKGVELIDINMGCPATKVVNSGSGSAILKDLKKVENIAKSVRAKVKIPLTAKIRAGWDLENVNAVEVSKILENEGFDLITVHGRTKTQKFNDFDWRTIQMIKNKIKIPIIGNGNIFSPNDAKMMFEETNCDGFMIGRASLSNPWIFRQILELEQKGKFEEISPKERLDYIRSFAEDFVNYTGEQYGIFEVRKFLIWLAKGLQNAKYLKEIICKMESIEELNLALK